MEFFENIILGIHAFYIRPHVPVRIIRVLFLVSDIPTESLKANKNLRKRALNLQYSFAQKTSLTLRISTHLKLRTICSHNTTKTISDISLQIFQKTCFCLVSEITFVLHHFLMPSNHILEVL